MKRKGFTLIEITISMALTLIIVSAAYSLLTTAIKINTNFRAEKELIENAPLLQFFFEREFERASDVEEVLGKDGIVYNEIGDTPIDAQCIKLTRAKHSLYQLSSKTEKLYINQLIYLRADDRRSVWTSKNKNETFNFNIANYKQYGGYEVGVHADSILISKIENNIYHIELIFKYYQTKFEYKTSFFVKTQK